MSPSWLTLDELYTSDVAYAPGERAVVDGDLITSGPAISGPLRDWDFGAPRIDRRAHARDIRSRLRSPRSRAVPVLMQAATAAP
jgi:hypothetical protein